MGQEKSNDMQEAGWMTFGEDGVITWTLITSWDLPGEKKSKSLSLSWKLPLKASGPILEMSKVRPKIRGVSLFLKLINLFVFIFGCVGSSLLCTGFL